MKSTTLVVGLYLCTKYIKPVATFLGAFSTSFHKYYPTRRYNNTLLVSLLLIMLYITYVDQYIVR